MLFNKSCSRLVYGTSLDKVKKLLDSADYSIKNFDYLYEISQGLMVKTEILKLKFTIQYFYANYLITNREVINTAGSTVHLEKHTIGVQESLKLKDLLLYEFEKAPLILQLMQQHENSNQAVAKLDQRIVRAYL